MISSRYVKTVATYLLQHGGNVLSENEAYIDGSSNGYFGYYWKNRYFIQKEQPLTNNQAEWMALLTLIIDLPVGWEGTVYTDSLLVANQFTGKYSIKHPELQRLANLCKSLIASKGIKMEVKWIPREQNTCGKEIDRLIRRDSKLRDWMEGKIDDQEER